VKAGLLGLWKTNLKEKRKNEEQLLRDHQSLLSRAFSAHVSYANEVVTPKKRRGKICFGLCWLSNVF
jgi:hypothetical protein